MVYYLITLLWFLFSVSCLPEEEYWHVHFCTTSSNPTKMNIPDAVLTSSGSNTHFLCKVITTSRWSPTYMQLLPSALLHFVPHWGFCAVMQVKIQPSLRMGTILLLLFLLTCKDTHLISLIYSMLHHVNSGVVFGCILICASFPFNKSFSSMTSSISRESSCRSVLLLNLIFFLYYKVV